MNEFIYETHLHTAQASACSDSPGRDHVQRYIDAGYTGVIVTDHFWRGNCAVDRSLPWPEFVKRFCQGYEDTLNEGIKRGLQVFFGWEETYEGDDYLIYGLDKQWLLEHPEVTVWSRARQFAEVHRFGGCVVQAHPFRAAWYIRGIHLAPYLVDAIEGFNAGNKADWNILGMRYASLSGLPVTAGSDNHHATGDAKLAGVAFDRALGDIGDYVEALKKGRPFRLLTPVPVPEWTDEIQPELPVEWLDEAERPMPVDTMRALNGEGQAVIRHLWR